MTGRLLRLLAAVSAIAALFAVPAVLAARGVDDDVESRTFDTAWRSIEELPGSALEDRRVRIEVRGVAGVAQDAECRRLVGRGDWACLSLAPGGEHVAAAWLAPRPGVQGARVTGEDDDPDTLPNR